MIDQVAYGDTITDSFDIEIHRTALGQPTQVAATSAGPAARHRGRQGRLELGAIGE